MKHVNLFWWTLTLTAALMLAIVLMCVWGYQQYFAGSQNNGLPERALAPVANRDSTLVSNDDSLARKLHELKQLRSEIATIITREEEKYRRDEASLLYRRNVLDSLRGEVDPNAGISKESGRPQDIAGQNMRRPVTVSNMDLLTLKRNRSTSGEAADVALFQGSFYLKTANITKGKLKIIIRKPDGEILLPKTPKRPISHEQSSYSLIIPFDSGNERVSFSLQTPPLDRGLYTVEVYYQGSLIGSLHKQLS